MLKGQSFFNLSVNQFNTFLKNHKNSLSHHILVVMRESFNSLYQKLSSNRMMDIPYCPDLNSKIPNLQPMKYFPL